MKKGRISKAIFILIMVNIFVLVNFVLAADNFWDQAADWYSAGGTETYLDSNVLSEIANIVEIIGTAVIAIATVVLGIKYVLGSVTDKASVKENMITLLIACIFFFGWSNIRDLLINNIQYDSSTGNIAVSKITGSTQLFIFSGTNSLESAFASIFSIIILIAKLVAVIATVYMGVKYIFSGAEQRAKLKEKGIMYIVGIILIFTTINVLSFISSSINNALV